MAQRIELKFLFSRLSPAITIFTTIFLVTLQHQWREKSDTNLLSDSKTVFLALYDLACGDSNGERKGSRSKSKPTEKQAESYVIVM